MGLTDSIVPHALIPQVPIRESLRANSSRYVFQKALGQGEEGETAVYYDKETSGAVVIKRFRDERLDVLRNPLPTALRPVFEDQVWLWPPEIPAAMLLGHSQHLRGFVPGLDYFLTCEPHSTRPTDRKCSWNLVTPLAAHGTLQSFAKDLRTSPPLTFSQLDSVYRASFEDILAGLAKLHDVGFCHDDVKPSNIFVDDSGSWFLGDVGQIRQASHTYHSTKLWSDTRQWSDCCKNDARRALKLYLAFLRAASGVPEDFDRAMFQGTESWSALYWIFVAKPTDASYLRRMSRELAPETVVEGRIRGLQPAFVPLRLIIGARKTLEIAVGEELATKLRYWGDTLWHGLALFGWRIEQPVLVEHS